MTASNLFSRLTGDSARFMKGVYGMEVEAERLLPEEHESLHDGQGFLCSTLRTIGRSWRAIGDGSLRHNGVEFVSPPYTVPELLAAVRTLYVGMDEGLFETSVRAGIHIHANMQQHTPKELRDVMRSYILLEPLLFRMVGVEREQNIYCVPLYRAANEQHLWRTIGGLLYSENIGRGEIMRLNVTLRGTCKYSALNLSPYMRFGTFEFRHAPTWKSAAETEAWVRAVDAVCSWSPPDTATIECVDEMRDTFSALIPRLDWGAYVREVEDRGLVEFAESLKPCTYKVAEWGRPAGMAFEAGGRAPTRYPRMRRQPATIRLSDLVLQEYANDYDGDESPEEE